MLGGESRLVANIIHTQPRGTRQTLYLQAGRAKLTLLSLEQDAESSIPHMRDRPLAS
jgi:hypothetical protein